MTSAKSSFNLSSLAFGIIGGIMMCGFVHASAFAMSVGNLMQPVAAVVDAAFGMGAAATSGSALAATAGSALVLTP